MSITKESLEAVESHWALSAIAKQARDRARSYADYLLLDRAVGAQMGLDFTERASDLENLEKLSMAYEMVAIESLDSMLLPRPETEALRSQCAAGASRAFEFRRLLAIPEDNEGMIFHVLHLGAVAYCGDRWSDLRRWLFENSDAIRSPSVADKSWEYRLLYRIYGCWIRLFRKKGWDDLDRIREIVAGLRSDQDQYETESFGTGTNAGEQNRALRLVTFYNWAKGTELLAVYMLQGEPAGILTRLTKHFEAAIDAAHASRDPQLEVLMRWLHAASRKMVEGSLWRVANQINSRVTGFVTNATKHQSMFELLPPQRAAIQEQGLLDTAATAVVIDLPTSGGKTLLAQFRMLQALNQYAQDGGWIAYVVPTRALSAQITRRLRRDFSPIGVKVEQLTGALEIDAIEDEMLNAAGDEKSFEILVCTPEKLQLIIRNKKISRPLALLVLDEAHNIESESRGLRIELLLATIKQEQARTNFLLMLPFVEKVEALTSWLAESQAAGRSVSLGTSPWKPNERIVGLFKAEIDSSVNAGWRLKYETLVTSPKTIHLKGIHNVDGVKPLNLPKSKFLDANSQQQQMGLQAAAMAKVFSERGTSIAVGANIPSVWAMAREVSNNLPKFKKIPERVDLVIRFLSTEIDQDFVLIEHLRSGVGVHHAGLSDEVRSLMEWLAENGDLRVLCTTTTLAQGINFPVSSVFIATHLYPYGVPMKPREFWNLAGRAGRMGQDSVGVVGLAEANRRAELIKFVRESTGELVSQLVTIVKDLDSATSKEDFEAVIYREEWEDFRCYVTHLVRETKELDKVIADIDLSLRNTFGYRSFQSSATGQRRAEQLREATRIYAEKISGNPGRVAMADMTGFSFEGVGRALQEIDQLEKKPTASDFTADKLFGNKGNMADLYGVMLSVPQLQRNLNEISEHGPDRTKLARITKDWVDGVGIRKIAETYFKSDNVTETEAITRACKAVYRNLVNNGTWGISAISRLSGIDFEKLSDEERRRIDLIPAMVYHGVKSEEGVLMRMNGVPRSIAELLGKVYAAEGSSPSGNRLGSVREFLENSEISVWDRSVSGIKGSKRLSGKEFREIWKIISG